MGETCEPLLSGVIMSTGSRPQKGAHEKTKKHATYLRVPNGCSECCYKAGETHGVVGHRTHAHQPCLKDITHGKLECTYCSAGLQPVWRGYVPLWDRDWTLRYSLIGEEYFETVEVIPVRSQVVVSRAKNPISPLVIRQEVKLVRELPDKEPWNKPIDMEELCLCLWKIPQLTEWVYANRTKAETLRAGTAKREDGKPFSPMNQAAAKRNGAPVDPPLVSDILKDRLSKVKAREDTDKTERNGHAHKPK